MNDEELDLSGVTMEISGQALIKALLPLLVRELSTDKVLQTQLANALLPGLRSSILKAARATTNSLGKYAGS